MMCGPPRGIRQRIGPVSTTTAPPSSSTRTARGGAAGASPGTTVKPSASSGRGPTACPDHFTDPSGQNASGQLCTAADAPAPPVILKTLSPGTCPHGQATPNVVPMKRDPPLPSSHRSSAGPAPAPAPPPGAGPGSSPPAARSPAASPASPSAAAEAAAC